MKNNSQDALDFLKLLYGDFSAGYTYIFTDADLKHRHYPLSDLSGVITDLEDLTERNVWYGIAPTRNKPARAKAANHEVAYLPGFYLDVDCGKVHGSEGGSKVLPATLEVGLSIVERCGYGKPTITVETGGGYQLYWLFNGVIEINDKNREHIQRLSKLFHGRFIQISKQMGYHADNTSDLCRIYRLPGTFNNKLLNKEKFPSLTDEERVYRPCIVTETTDRRSDVDYWEIFFETELQAGTQEISVTSDASKWTVLDVFREAEGAKPELKKMLRLCAAGKSFADSSNRHNSMLKIAGWAAQKLPNVEASVIAACCDPIWREWGGIQAEGAKFSKMIEDFRLKDGANRAQKAQAMLRYSAQLLKNLKEIIGPKATLRHAIISHKGKMYYVFNPVTKSYEGVVAANLRPKLHEIHGFDYYQIVKPETENTPAGIRKTENMETAVTTIEEVFYDATISKSRYVVDTNSLYIAIVPINEFEPKYDEEIQKWLRALFPKMEDFDQFINWLACFKQTDSPLQALLLTGSTSIGKTLLANCLASAFGREGVSKLDSIVNTFQDQLVKQSFFYVDEEAPAVNTSTGKNAVALIKEYIASPNHPINPKGSPVVTRRGYLRLLITLNNEAALFRDLTNNNKMDIRAIAERFLKIKTGDEARDYLDGLPQKTKDAWYKDGLFWSHVEALVARKTFRKGSRFLVYQDPENIKDFARFIVRKSRIGMQLLDWALHAYCQAKPQPLKVKDGKLLVTYAKVRETWELYKISRNVPQSEMLELTLEAISIDIIKEKNEQAGYDETYYALDTELLIDYGKAKYASIQRLRTQLAQSKIGIVKKEQSVTQDTSQTEQTKLQLNKQ